MEKGFTVRVKVGEADWEDVYFVGSVTFSFREAREAVEMVGGQGASGYACKQAPGGAEMYRVTEHVILVLL